MSDPLPIAVGGAAPRPDVRAAIARAAEQTGTDFDYLLAQARIESSLDPSARAGTSSAAGLYQFTRGTWLETLERHGDEHGLGWAADAISGGRIADPQARRAILALRHDPDAAALMAGELASDNRASLQAALGREPDAAELYLAHFLGIGGATRLLRADPSSSAAALLPDAAAANRTIFYEGGVPRSAGGVIDLIRGKVSRAMERDGGGAGGTGWPSGGPFAPAPAGFPLAAQPVQSAAPQPVARPSMAETLRATFALGSADSAVPAHVRAAYGRLRSAGL